MTSLPSFCFKSGYKFSVSLDADVSVAVVGTRKSDTKRNFPCIALQCPVVLTSLKSNLVSTFIGQWFSQFNKAQMDAI